MGEGTWNTLEKARAYTTLAFLTWRMTRGGPTTNAGARCEGLKKTRMRKSTCQAQRRKMRVKRLKMKTTGRKERKRSVSGCPRTAGTRMPGSLEKGKRCSWLSLTN